MNTRGDPSWSWLTRGEAPQDLLQVVRNVHSPYVATRRKKGDPDFRPPFCYPGTNMSFTDEEIELIRHVLREHCNLIGVHTMDMAGEGGFAAAQELEAKAIGMMAGVLGGHGEDIDGFFCGGGTESVLQGMWVGREVLRTNMMVEPSATAIMTSQLHHYSINKAAWLLGFGYYRLNKCSRCGQRHLFERPIPNHGINLVGVNDRGEMSVTDLERRMANLYTSGVRRFLIVATAGTTMMGSIDPIDDIITMCRAFADERVSLFSERQRPLFYVHVDASFGAFTIPFLDGAPAIGFDIPGVDSITADADKMGQLPYPSGIFLCRKGLLRYVESNVNYVGGHCDSTVPGSRSLLAPAMAWLRWRRLGTSGQHAYVKECVTQRDCLAQLLRERFNANCLVEILHTSPYVNILPMVIRLPRGHQVNLSSPELVPYELRSDCLPPPIDDRTLRCPDQVYKIVVMPHMFQYFSRFVDDLTTAIDNAIKVA